ncbi:MAG: hypothetical protein OH319_01935 [Candidatus Parvarchaeota archaeon]|nr:hypothetical protein [Candidatus Jingweiarchaeum tengchongense]MCW1298131.1 hypothetical protein [Candidatus Jingweiarchaeum tengchongense]MCW1299930.1 hypothetical protein [Candidatus Jingweiarchaeum tengchongense]MCW1305552.1 hypothetical protein [Candidatus Jingweiarchaeum tengchongense]MCW1309478.1 hypothetical protein [Candidatus Jingweiarchaeum tengchongense]
MKRGISFSIITFLFLIPILTFIITYSESMQSIRRESIKKILSDQNIFFSKTLLNDLEKMIWITGKRAIISAIQRVIKYGTPLNDSISVIKELMQNGTIFGVNETLMQNNTIGYWINLIQLEQNVSAFNFSIAYSNLEVDWESFNCIFNVSFSINVSDISNTTRSTRIGNISILVSIEKMEDPIYPLYTNGLFRKSIKICNSTLPEVRSLAFGTIASKNVTGISVIGLSSNLTYIQSIQNKSDKILVTDNLTIIGSALINAFKGVVADHSDLPAGITVPYIINTTNATTSIPDARLIYLDEITKKVWDIEKFEDTINTGCYHISLNGSNIFGRLEGKLNSTGNKSGIESFVDVRKLISMDIPVKENQTLIDYLYFSNNSHPGCKVRGINETWFRIDPWNAERYGVGEILDCS